MVQVNISYSVLEKVVKVPKRLLFNQILLTGRDGRFIAQSRRIAMLRYKSWVLHLLSSLIFSPALLAGPMEEKQILQIEMFSEFLEIVVRPS